MKGWGEVAVDLGWRSKSWPAFLTALDPTTKFGGGKERGGALWAHARRCAQMKCVIPQEGLEATSARQQFLSDRYPTAIAEEQREQLSIGQCWRA